MGIKKENKFVLIFLLTIIITRLVIYIIPRNSFVYTDEFHHIYYGIILLIVYFFIKEKLWSYIPLAIALGLIIDQITQLPFYISHALNYSLAPISFWDYWSLYSVTSTALATIVSVYLICKRQS